MALVSLVSAGIVGACGSPSGRPQDPRNEARDLGSTTQEAWDPTNAPSVFQSDYETKFASLPTQGRTANEPWADSYWPNQQGGIAHRWNASSPGLRSAAWTYSLLTKAQVAAMSEAERAQLSPSEKYDILLGRYDYPFTVWQRKNTSPSDDSWWGICHGWAPAAYAFREPKPVVAISRDGIRIPFGSSDVKAMLSFQQAREGRGVILGQRCNADLSRDPQAGGTLACRDTNAGSFHVVLANEVGKRRTPFVADITRDLEVWNQPIVSYESRVLSQRPRSAQAAPGTVVEYQVTTDLVYVVEMAPSWTPHVGIDNALGRSRYVYYVEVDAAGRVVGGSWVSGERPDFLWKNAPVRFTGLFAPLEDLYEASVGGNGVVRPPITPVPRPVVVDARCPVGGTFDTQIGFCTVRLSSGDLVAIGPFTAAMTDLCEVRGGGESCRQELPFELPDGTLFFAQRWNRDFAARLRGTGVCALGASPQARYGGYCVENARALDGRPVRNAYGPFSAELVEKCLQNGGGTPCLTQRWDADFLLTLL